MPRPADCCSWCRFLAVARLACSQPAGWEQKSEICPGEKRNKRCWKNDTQATSNLCSIQRNLLHNCKKWLLVPLYRRAVPSVHNTRESLHRIRPSILKFDLHYLEAENSEAKKTTHISIGWTAGNFQVRVTLDIKCLIYYSDTCCSRCKGSVVSIIRKNWPQSHRQQHI